MAYHYTTVVLEQGVAIHKSTSNPESCSCINHAHVVHPGEVGHNHMRTKSGRVAPYTRNTKPKSCPKALAAVFDEIVLYVEFHEKRASSAILHSSTHPTSRNLSSLWAIVVGFFHCYNTRSHLCFNFRLGRSSTRNMYIQDKNFAKFSYHMVCPS